MIYQPQHLVQNTTADRQVGLNILIVHLKLEAVIQQFQYN